MEYSARSHRAEQKPHDYHAIAAQQGITVQYTGNDPGYELDLGASGGKIICKKDPQKIAELVKMARACAWSEQVGDHLKILNLYAARGSLDRVRPLFMERKRPQDIENPKDWVSVRQLLEEAGIDVELLCKVDPAQNEPNRAPVALEQEKLPELG